MAARSTHTEIVGKFNRRCRLCRKRIYPGTAMVVTWSGFERPKQVVHIGYFHTTPCGVAMTETLQEEEEELKKKKS